MQKREECLQKIQKASGLSKMVKINGKHTWRIVVRMTTWRHEAMVYEARKDCAKCEIKLKISKSLFPSYLPLVFARPTIYSASKPWCNPEILSY